MPGLPDLTIRQMPDPDREPTRLLESVTRKPDGSRPLATDVRTISLQGVIHENAYGSAIQSALSSDDARGIGRGPEPVQQQRSPVRHLSRTGRYRYLRSF